jgi:hypothetical protein
MKHTVTTKLYLSRIKRGAIRFATGALFFVAFQHPAFAQWTQASEIGNISISCVASGAALVACGHSKPDTSTIFISSNNGTSWAAAATNVPTIVTTIVNVGTSFIVGSDQPGASIYSTNFGSTWNPNILDFPNPIISHYSIYSLVVIGTTIFAGTGSGVFQQTSAGAAWTADTTGTVAPDAFGPANAVCFLVSGSNFFMGTQENGAYLSTNAGVLWTPVDNGLPKSFFYGTTIDGFMALGSTIYAAVADTDGIHTEIYSSTNDGSLWTKSNTQSQNWGTGYGFVTSGAAMFAATDSGVFYSLDKGADWIQADQGLPAYSGSGHYVTAIDTSGGNLVIGTGSNGVWTRKLSDFGGASVSSNTSASSNDGLSLTITENPASSAGTKIVYTLHNGGLTQVLLMDELGRTVRMLQNGDALAGQNIVSLDTRSLAPGTYFVRVEADGMTAMQKLVISR